ncbi:hypothetical protein ACFL0D_02670 [Thermoproteota archaeon]
MRSKILLGLTSYGLVVGFLSSWWWQISDNPFLLNIPGVILGDTVYELSIQLFGVPFSPQANSTIPWVLRVPQVYIPVSVIVWFLCGLLIQALYNKVYLNNTHATSGHY